MPILEKKVLSKKISNSIQKRECVDIKHKQYNDEDNIHEFWFHHFGN